jgi:hypothetical protein
MGWKEAINTYPSSIVYEIHDLNQLIFLHKKNYFKTAVENAFRRVNDIPILPLLLHLNVLKDLISG